MKTNDTGAKPLFIPLKREFFEAFKRGTKTEEYRLEGPRWNARTCFVGRHVVLSLGYGKSNRLQGVVTGYRACIEPTSTPAWRDCYGDRPGMAACIQIQVVGAL
jgi:hypothetical protein